MIIETIVDKDEIRFEFVFEEDDIENPTKKFSIGQKQATIRSEEYDLSDTHNDLLALTAILICNPFVGSQLKIPFAPSDYFVKMANGVLSRYKIVVESGEKPPERLKKPLNPRPGLAFSGGVDSTAALGVMPGNTVPVFMDRPLRKGSLYNPEAAHHSCELLSELGYDAHLIYCDLEYVRDPVGFPTDVANAVPLIILAEQLGIGSISFGTVLESAYGTGHEQYRDYMNGSHWNFFGTLFAAAGIPMSLPIAGISEVGTSIISHRSPVGMVSQSCIRGTWGNPCISCWKCFRKGLLGVALRQRKYNEQEFKSLFKSNEVKGKLSELPISHENVVSFAINRMKTGLSEELDLLYSRTHALGTLPLLTKWYSPSIELIPKGWREVTREKIMRYLRVMGRKEEIAIETWNMDDFLLSEQTNSARLDLIEKWAN